MRSKIQYLLGFHLTIYNLFVKNHKKVKPSNEITIVTSKKSNVIYILTANNVVKTHIYKNVY